MASLYVLPVDDAQTIFEVLAPKSPQEAWRYFKTFHEPREAIEECRTGGAGADAWKIVPMPKVLAYAMGLGLDKWHDLPEGQAR